MNASRQPLTPMNAPARSPRKAILTFVFVTVLIDMLAFGMIIRVLPMVAAATEPA
jgi:hypothetical protein